MVKPTTYCINWHNENAPIYSAHFEPHGKGRLATAGGDNNVRLWKVESTGEDRKISYLTTLIKHTQSVNVVRFAPRGEMLASAGDDGNVLLWVPSESHHPAPSFGDDSMEDKETWRVKHMCRSFGSEIYDLAWSPDGVFFITGSMDNVARIYNAQTGQTVRQIAEHNHYVQGVAWDPLNEFVATQSSDRSVHIYTLKTKDGQFTLAQHGKFSKMDLPARRISSNSPAPPELGSRPTFGDSSSLAIASPAPSAPGTPTSLSLPMNPPAIAHSRRSSFSSSPSIRRSASPAPSLPLPAVKPMDASPKPHYGPGVRNANIYANETFTSFFRRLSFTPDGSLLFTPAGQYKTSHPSSLDVAKAADDVINTVYIYTRAGFNKPPIAHLPGHKKPSLAVKCSPVYYTHRKVPQATKTFTVDTSSADDSIPSLPEPAVSPIPSHSSVMDPPPIIPNGPAPTSDPSAPIASPKPDLDGSSSTSGPPIAFSLPYRIVYAVATQDAVLVYDTQQQHPLCIVSNLHFATFTDLTWSTDGLTLLMSSSDGFCSTLTFLPGELGTIYPSTVPTFQHPSTLNTSASSAHSTPTPTPTSATAPPLHIRSSSNPLAPSPSPSFTTTTPATSSAGAGAGAGAAITTPAPSIRPSSPTRTNSNSSIATQMSFAPTGIATPAGSVVSNPTPTMGSVPSVTASGMPMQTPPQTPLPGPGGKVGTLAVKRESEGEAERERRDAAGAGDGVEGSDGRKRRRVAPTLVLKDGA